MGHERTGILPKTKKWRDIVEQIAGLSGGEFDVSSLAANTLEAVHAKLTHLQRDPQPLAALSFLIELATAASDTGNVAGALGRPATTQVTPLRLAAELRDRLDRLGGEHEYRELSAAAATDALVSWYMGHRVRDVSLFEDLGRADTVWSKLGDGAGFCELSRLYFARLVERYLRYFLDREAARVRPSVAHRDQLATDLEDRLDDISQHAFETSRITQSYAAGWFNKYGRGGMPTAEHVRVLFDHQFAKLRDAIAQEGTRT